MALSDAILCEFEVLKDNNANVPKIAFDYAYNVVATLRRNDVMISGADGVVFLEWPTSRLLCVISAAAVTIDRIAHDVNGHKVHIQHRPTSFQECARLISLEIADDAKECIRNDT